jgi:hypothetical protein
MKIYFKVSSKERRLENTALGSCGCLKACIRTVRSDMQHTNYRRNPVLDQPPHNPYPAQTDWHFFPKMTEHLSGQHLSYDEVKTAAKK